MGHNWQSYDWKKKVTLGFQTEIGTENISFKEGRKLANLEKTAWIKDKI